LKHFDYEEFGAQLAYERDYPENYQKEKECRNKDVIISEIKQLLKELDEIE